MASQYVTPEAVKTMRQDGGGLIFIMTSHQTATRLKLPFLADLFEDISNKYPVFQYLAPTDIPYDTKSSFSVYINHRKTFTGITDNDRSLTMKRFAELIQETKQLKTTEAVQKFGSEFRTPGHVPICVASNDLLKQRQGHTELVVALMEMSNLIPAGSGCEIMGNNGKAQSKKTMQTYAKKHNLVFLEGHEIITAWRQWSK